jgi:hypothetical protein
MPEPILFNRFESAASVGNNVIGANFTKQGVPTYAACKFGNGIYINQNGEAADFASFQPGKTGCVECWIKPDWASTDGTNHIICDSVLGGTPRFLFYWNATWKNFAFGYDWNNPAGGYVRATTWPGHNAGDLIHIAAVWDENGIEGGANLLRIYMNNTLHGSGNTANFPALQIGIRVGNQSAASIIVPFDGVIDNMKFYDYAKVDFSDRHDERGGMNDQVIVL